MRLSALSLVNYTTLGRHSEVFTQAFASESIEKVVFADVPDNHGDDGFLRSALAFSALVLHSTCQVTKEAPTPPGAHTHTNQSTFEHMIRQHTLPRDGYHRVPKANR